MLFVWVTLNKVNRDEKRSNTQATYTMKQDEKKTTTAVHETMIVYCPPLRKRLPQNEDDSK